MRHMNRGIAIVALVGAFVFGTSVKSEAAFMAYICDDAACDGAGDTIVTDEGAGDGLAGVAGAILVVGANVGGYEITINTAQSKPALTSGMDVNYTVTNIVGASAGTVWLYASDTDFAGPQGLGGSLGGTSDNGSVTAIICGGDNNNARNPVNAGPCTTATDNTAANGISVSLAHAATANPYSLSIGVAVSLAGVGTTATGDFRVIPEPASVALFGLALAGVAAYRRRQQ
jgi:hypothetical protein